MELSYSNSAILVISLIPSPPNLGGKDNNYCNINNDCSFPFIGKKCVTDAEEFIVIICLNATAVLKNVLVGLHEIRRCVNPPTTDHATDHRPLTTDQFAPTTDHRPPTSNIIYRPEIFNFF